MSASKLVPLLVVLVTLYLLMVGCGNTNIDESIIDESIIEGKVSWFATPLADRIVQLEKVPENKEKTDQEAQADDVPVYETLTDETGRYIFENVMVGEYLLVLTLEEQVGYCDIVASIILESGEPTNVDFEVPLDFASGVSLLPDGKIAYCYTSD